MPVTGSSSRLGTRRSEGPTINQHSHSTGLVTGRLPGLGTRNTDLHDKKLPECFFDGVLDPFQVLCRLSVPGQERCGLPVLTLVADRQGIRLGRYRDERIERSFGHAGQPGTEIR